jgi:Flp pilus assembly protein CpaB
MTDPLPPDNDLLKRVEQAIRTQQRTGLPAVDDFNRLRPVPTPEFQSELQAMLLAELQANVKEETMSAKVFPNPVRAWSSLPWVTAAALFAIALLAVLFVSMPGALPAAVQVTETIPAPTATPVQTSTVVVTTRTIAWGTRLDADGGDFPFTVAEMPNDQIPTGAVTDMALLDGLYVRRVLPAGQIVQQTDITRTAISPQALPGNVGAFAIPLVRIANSTDNLSVWDVVDVTFMLGARYAADPERIQIALATDTFRYVRVVAIDTEAEIPNITLAQPLPQVMLLSYLLDGESDDILTVTVTRSDEVTSAPVDERGQVTAFAPEDVGSCGNVVPMDFNAAWGNPLSEGELIANFSSHHTGIDFEAPTGTEVRATNVGRVLYAGWSEYGYGYVVVLSHGPFMSLYAHLDEIRVRCAQVVQAGAVVGTVGMSGNTTRPHLHFEIRQGGLPLNPLMLLEEN